jgi:hypothetical protein
MTGCWRTAYGSETKLPALVQRYVERTLPPGGSLPKLLRITQTGEMWQKPGGRALRFTAVEELAVGEVAFSWQAWFRMAPLISFRVHDWYRAGEGGLGARLLGLPVMSSRGVEVAQGEAMRYLTELPWVPHALVANRQLSWRELDATSVEVATRVVEATVAVRLEFDGAGDIVGAFADARPRREGKANVPTPWTGDFSAYDVVGGIRMPTRGEVRWELPEGPFTYWRGKVTEIELGH